MTRVCATAFMVSACLACVAPPVVAQSDPPVLRTPYGDPDIQGLFTFRTLTPLQRPVIDAGASAVLAGKVALTDEEAAAYEASRRKELNRDTQNLAVHAPGVRYQSLAEGGVGGYNEFWYERSIELTNDKRTSLIVDPPNGRIPYREEYQAAARIRGTNISNGFADSYADRSLSDRCLMGFNAGPPMVSSAYNNNVHILQTPDHVVILNEMVHNARIIPLDGRPRGRLRQYAGESRGRWEGETLVVETRNFLRETSLGGSSRDTYLVERFRRVDPDTVMYEFTVEDANGYTRPWTAMMPLRRTDGPLFEYACHEGNIGLAGILAGARNLDTQRQVIGPPQSSAEFVPVTDAMLQAPAPEDWLMWRRTLDSWGYSPLDQVTRENVRELRMVWSRALAPGRQEGTPLAYDGVLYMPQASDVIEAIDAVTGDLRWVHRRDLPDDVYDYVGGNARTNRNIAIYDRFIINTSDDNYVFGLDATTGEIAWETQIFDYQVQPVGHSSGPIIADGKVIAGGSCRPRGGPESCVVTAHDARTGQELWRRRTIPAPGEPGDETWGGVPFERRLHVGTWMPPSYDPDLRLIYIGTSVTSPAPKFMLGGVDNTHLYHNSTLALAVDTGEIRWYYQHLNDHWDLDHPFERILLDTAVTPNADAVSWINPRVRPGEVRKVMTGIPGKTGVVYTLDRETGEFLWATPTIAQNVISDIDGATGVVTENPEVVFNTEGQQVLVCPDMHGGKDWEAGAYSPLTNTMYFPLRNMCQRLLATTAPDASHRIYALAVRHELAPGTDQLGAIYAISAETGATTWLYEQRAATLSLVATGGGLVFGGDANGRFRALDHETGEVLWEVNLGSPVSGFPISYAVDGRQYVAVSTGGAATTPSFLQLTPELRPSNGNNLFVFALPQ